MTEPANLDGDDEEEGVFTPGMRALAIAFAAGRAELGPDGVARIVVLTR